VPVSWSVRIRVPPRGRQGRCSVYPRRRQALSTRHGPSQLSVLNLPLERFTARMKPDIGSKSRFLPTPPAFDVPIRGRRFPSEYRHARWYGETRMVSLPGGEIFWKISLFVFTECTNVTDTQTDGQTDGHRMMAYAALAQHRAAIKIRAIRKP